MKKIILFSVAACSLAFYACKKDSNNDTTIPPVDIPADTLDATALTAATTVGFATNVKGDIPAASSDGPLLKVDGYDNRTYSAISDRYIVIYPQSVSGYIAGYYVKINGADSYFKVVYPKTDGLRKASDKHTGLREEGDNSDSAIVIKLPASIQTDTFTIKYAAYDTLNRVSNTLTAFVNLVAIDSSSNSLLSGNYKISRYSHDGKQWYDQLSSDSASVVCNDGVLNYCEGDCMKIVSYTNGYSFSLQFDGKKQLGLTQQYINRQLNLEGSTCSTPAYDDYSNQANTLLGGYSYNAASKTLLLIIDGGGKSVNDTYASNLYTETYKVSEISANKLVLYTAEYNNEGRDYIYTTFQEFLKQ
jgi:hypothetical protein